MCVLPPAARWLHSFEIFSIFVSHSFFLPFSLYLLLSCSSLYLPFFLLLFPSFPYMQTHITERAELIHSDASKLMNQMRSEVLTAVKLSTVVFRVVRLCS